MSYSQFTIESLKKEFNLIVQERQKIFENITPINPSSHLQETLQENIPLALAIHTEKARSELIIAPILVEIRKLFAQKISIFSGTEFNVDSGKGLTGNCDFIISYSPEQLVIEAPIITLIEAKNDNIKSGIAQCMAEMVAAQIFNQQKNNLIPCIYGVITTGSLWKFIKLAENTIYIEPLEHFIDNLDTILGIFGQIINTTHPLEIPQ